MTAKIQKILGDPAASEGSGGVPAVMSELVFGTENDDVYQSTSSFGCGRGAKLELNLKSNLKLKRQ